MDVPYSSVPAHDLPLPSLLDTMLLLLLINSCHLAERASECAIESDGSILMAIGESAARRYRDSAPTPPATLIVRRMLAHTAFLSSFPFGHLQ